VVEDQATNDHLLEDQNFNSGAALSSQHDLNHVITLSDENLDGEDLTNGDENYYNEMKRRST